MNFEKPEVNSQTEQEDSGLTPLEEFVMELSEGDNEDAHFVIDDYKYGLVTSEEIPEEDGLRVKAEELLQQELDSKEWDKLRRDHNSAESTIFAKLATGLKKDFDKDTHQKIRALRVRSQQYMEASLEKMPPEMLQRWAKSNSKKLELNESQTAKETHAKKLGLLEQQSNDIARVQNTILRIAVERGINLDIEEEDGASAETSSETEQNPEVIENLHVSQLSAEDQKELRQLEEARKKVADVGDQGTEKINPNAEKVERQVEIYLEKHPDASPESIAKVRQNWETIVGLSASAEQMGKDIQETYAKKEEKFAASLRESAQEGRDSLAQATTAAERSRISENIAGNEEWAKELEEEAVKRRKLK
jgi:hypothetical protein